jgi:predicted GIY-YIG superfamily endonuclease
MDFKIPDIDIGNQKKIAAVLSALDAKIELNNRINAELEAMAKTLYDYWFVQFDFPCLPPDYQSIGARKPSCHDGEGKPSGLEAVCTYRAVGGLPVPEAGKHFVYVLLCLPASGDAQASDDFSFYIGMTDDLYRRWFEHKTGNGAKWTKSHRPVKVIHHEIFDSKETAAAREQELKTGFGRKWIKREYAKLKSTPAPSGQAGSPAPSGQAGSPAHQSKLMQAGKMVYNDNLKRHIPEGWSDGTLDDVGQIVGGSTPSTKNPNNFSTNGIPWITPNDLSGNKHNKFITRGAMDVSEAGMKSASLKKYPAGTVLLTSRAPIGYMAIARGEVTTNQGFKSFIPSKEYSSAVVFYTVKTALPVILKHGSGSTFQEISSAVLKMVPVCLPVFEVTEAFTSKINPIFDRQNILEQESRHLMSLRDFLLPMLLNGQVQVT